MEALNRKPKLTVRREMSLDEKTKIEVVGITARKSLEIVNNKRLTDAERGLCIIAAKIRVNGQPIVLDDLLDKFTDEEVVKITELVTADAEETEKNA